MTPLLYDSHVHTTLCQHATCTPLDCAPVAARRGLRGIVITCHNPMPQRTELGVRMAPVQFAEYLRMVADARANWHDTLDVRLGLECDWLPGDEPFLAQQLATAPLDFVWGSVHPQLPDYRARYWHDDPLAFQRQYFTHLAEAAETKLFDALAHPDIVKLVTHRSWQPRLLLDHLRRCLDRIAATGVAMELNTSGWYKPGLREFNPGPLLLREIHARGIPIVLGSDSHEARRVGDLFIEALDLLDALDFRTVSVYAQHRRQDLDLAQCRASLAACQS